MGDGVGVAIVKRILTSVIAESTTSASKQQLSLNGTWTDTGIGNIRFGSEAVFQQDGSECLLRDPKPDIRGGQPQCLILAASDPRASWI